MYMYFLSSAVLSALEVFQCHALYKFTFCLFTHSEIGLCENCFFFRRCKERQNVENTMHEIIVYVAEKRELTGDV